MKKREDYLERIGSDKKNERAAKAALEAKLVGEEYSRLRRKDFTPIEALKLAGKIIGI